MQAEICESVLKKIDYSADNLKNGFPHITVDRHLRTTQDGCWAEVGHGAIYGFSLAHKTSHEKDFLDIAEKLTDFLIHNLPDDYVPYWGFSRSDDPPFKDTFAANRMFCLFDII